MTARHRRGPAAWPGASSATAGAGSSASPMSAEPVRPPRCSRVFKPASRWLTPWSRPHPATARHGTCATDRRDPGVRPALRPGPADARARGSDRDRARLRRPGPFARRIARPAPRTVRLPSRGGARSHARLDLARLSGDRPAHPDDRRPPGADRSLTFVPGALGAMRGLMKLATGLGHVDVGDVPTPVPGPGEVLVEVQATGICGADLHIKDDEFPSRPPVVMGHEVSGVVVAAGAGADAARRAAGRARDLLLHMRRLRRLPFGPAQPVSRAAVDRVARERRVREPRGRSGPQPPRRRRDGRRACRRAVRAARLRGERALRPAGSLAR